MQHYWRTPATCDTTAASSVLSDVTISIQSASGIHADTHMHAHSPL